jgi:Protein of unknown function (DUF1838)
MRITPVRGAIVLAALFTSSIALAARPKGLDLDTPEGGIEAFRKVQCSTEDQRPTVYYWVGETYARVDGEPDKLLFKFEGMNVRQCTTVTDPVRGKGFRQVSREVLYYKDPVTGEILDGWKNPWTGDTVKVLHIANDPVNFRSPVFPKGADGKPYKSEIKVMGDHWWGTTTVPLFYRNPLAGEYQDAVGGMYHATEMFNFFGRTSDLSDPKKPSADVDVAWARISEWLPWMKMRGRQGLLYFNGAGRKLDSYADLPESMRKAVEARNPGYSAPPPVDDARPNETSWSYYKKMNPPPEAK